MLKLVSNRRSVRRAILVCEHPDLGLVVLDRNLFRRAFRSPADECGQRGNLIERATKLLKKTFRNVEPTTVRRCEMFFVRGLTPEPTECTVFFFTHEFEEVYDKLPKSAYIRLSEHPLAGHIEPTLKSVRNAVEAVQPAARYARG